MSGRLLCAIYLTITISQLILADNDTNIETAFRKSELIPDVISIPPPKICQITYPCGIIRTGEIISELNLTERPNVTWEGADPNSLYTLYVAGLTNWTVTQNETDLTRPTTWPETKMWHQWVQINIPGTQENDGETLFPYHVIYNPPMKKVIDRYCFLIYQQAHRIIPPPPKYRKEYFFQEFCPPHQFFYDFNLTGPVAGNFFLTQIELHNYKEWDGRTVGYVRP